MLFLFLCPLDAYDSVNRSLEEVNQSIHMLLPEGQGGGKIEGTDTYYFDVLGQHFKDEALYGLGHILQRDPTTDGIRPFLEGANEGFWIINMAMTQKRQGKTISPELLQQIQAASAIAPQAVRKIRALLEGLSAENFETSSKEIVKIALEIQDYWSNYKKEFVDILQRKIMVLGKSTKDLPKGDPGRHTFLNFRSQLSVLGSILRGDIKAFFEQRKENLVKLTNLGKYVAEFERPPGQDWYQTLSAENPGSLLYHAVRIVVDDSALVYVADDKIQRLMTRVFKELYLIFVDKKGARDPAKENYNIWIDVKRQYLDGDARKIFMESKGTSKGRDARELMNRVLSFFFPVKDVGAGFGQYITKCYQCDGSGYIMKEGEENRSKCPKCDMTGLLYPAFSDDQIAMQKGLQNFLDVWTEWCAQIGAEKSMLEE